MRATRRSGSCVERNDSFRSTSLEKLDDARCAKIERGDSEERNDRERGQLPQGHGCNEPDERQHENGYSVPDQDAFRGDALSQGALASENEQEDIRKTEHKEDVSDCHNSYLLSEVRVLSMA